MTNTFSTGERRPTINVNAWGEPYIRVYTRHGYRTRHMTRQGLLWLRARYPATEYPSVATIPLTYAVYHEMSANGFIETHTKPMRDTRSGSNPPRAHPPTAGRPLIHWTGNQLEQLFRDNPTHSAVLESLANELQYRRRPRMRMLRRQVEAALEGAKRVPGAGAPPPEPCGCCAKEQPESARFCRNCGRPIGQRPSAAGQSPPQAHSHVTVAAHDDASTIPHPHSGWNVLVPVVVAALVLMAFALLASNGQFNRQPASPRHFAPSPIESGRKIGPAGLEPSGAGEIYKDEFGGIIVQARARPIRDPFAEVPTEARGVSIGTARGVGMAENGSRYGEISSRTGRPKDTYVHGYYRRDGTYVRGHYRSR